MIPSDATYYALEGNVLAEPFEVSEGRMTVPYENGHGIDVDPDAVEAYRV